MPMTAVSVGAIGGGVAAGVVALLCFIGLYWRWRRRHPKEAFFDVPGKLFLVAVRVKNDRDTMTDLF